MHALQQINITIKTTAQYLGRDPNKIILIAVSKGQTSEKIKTILQAGQKHFGENYLQEAIPKITELQKAKLTWHYLGKIQSNKINDLVKYFDYIHSVDSLKHAEALSKACTAQNKIMPIFLQVNFEDEASKNGFNKEVLFQELPYINKLPNLKVLGLMLIPSPKDNEAQRATFAAFQNYRTQLSQTTGIALPELSMGMSNDFIAAIQEGTSYLRIGTKIFGARA